MHVSLEYHKNLTKVIDLLHFPKMHVKISHAEGPKVIQAAFTTLIAVCGGDFREPENVLHMSAHFLATRNMTNAGLLLFPYKG